MNGTQDMRRKPDGSVSRNRERLVIIQKENHVKLNMDQVLNDPDGNPRRRVDQETDGNGTPLFNAEGQPKFVYKGDLRLQDVLFNCVNATYPGPDGKPNCADMYLRGKLARKIKGGGSKHYSAEEINLMVSSAEKRLVGDPLLLLTVGEIIDPCNEKFKPDAEPEEC